MKIFLKFLLVKIDDYTTVWLLDYAPLKESYKMIEIDLSKQQALNVDQKQTQQIDFTPNLDWPGQTFIFFIYEQVKETILDFS